MTIQWTVRRLGAPSANQIAREHMLGLVEARRTARDAGGHDGEAWHDGRVDGVAQAIRAVRDVIRRDEGRADA